MGSSASWFDQWPDGLIALDSSAIITGISASATRILGWLADEAIGKSAHDLLCSQSRGHAHGLEHCPLHDCYIDPSADNEHSSTVWRHREGHYQSVDYRVMDFSYQGSHCLLSFVDNESREFNRSELEKFAEYVALSPAPIAEFDDFGQMLFGNDALQQRLLEHGFDDSGQALVVPKDIEELCAQLRNKVDETDTRLDSEVNVEDTVYSWHFHPLDSGHERTMLAYAFDISERKRAERQAQEQRAKVRKEFYATMVHELRTPLNAIVGFSQILLARTANTLGENELERLEMIKNAGMQLNEMITKTLDLTKIESGKMSLDISAFELGQLLAQTFEQLKPLAEQKGLSYRFTTMTHREICSDQLKIKQITNNLLSNAIKYTPEGSVHFLLSEKEDEEIGTCFSLLVSDTGAGIPNEKIDTLFKQFEQVEEHKDLGVEGTGIGLALVNNLVQLLGGKIEVSSEYGQGSSFEVLLPFESRFNQAPDDPESPA